MQRIRSDQGSVEVDSQRECHAGRIERAGALDIRLGAGAHRVLRERRPWNGHGLVSPVAPELAKHGTDPADLSTAGNSLLAIARNCLPMRFQASGNLG